MQHLWRIEDYASDAISLHVDSSKSVQRLVQLENPETTQVDTVNPAVAVDTGNIAFMAISLVFTRLRSYAVNARNVYWRERVLYCWATFLWFSSFQTADSTIMTNKRNMLLETISFIFLVPRDGVSQTQCLAEEGNEHFCVLWIMILWELNMEQLIQIVQKSIIKLQAIFESSLFTSRSNSTFKGYHKSFPDFI